MHLETPRVALSLSQRCALHIQALSRSPREKMMQDPETAPRWGTASGRREHHHAGPQDPLPRLVPLVGERGSSGGWESDFAGWAELMERAAEAMRDAPSDPGLLQAVEACWAISEESEDLLRFAEDHLDECRAWLRRLANSNRATVRWQVYEAIIEAGEEADEILRAGLHDEDSYARRRAALALARTNPPDAKALTKHLMSKEDAYERQAALEMAAAAKDERYLESVCEALRKDPVKHVRDAANQRREGQSPPKKRKR